MERADYWLLTTGYSRAPSSSAVRSQMAPVLGAALGKPRLPAAQLGAVTGVAGGREGERIAQPAEEIDQHVVRERAGCEPRRQHEIGHRHARDLILVAGDRIAHLQREQRRPTLKAAFG